MGYVLVALTVVLTVYGQFVIKWQVLKAGPLPVEFQDRLGYLVKLLLNPWIDSGLAAAFAAALCWMLAMSKLPLSQAYPYTAVSFILIVVVGAWLFSEPLPANRVIGVVLIGLGVIVAGLE